MRTVFKILLILSSCFSFSFSAPSFQTCENSSCNPEEDDRCYWLLDYCSVGLNLNISFSTYQDLGNGFVGNSRTSYKLFKIYGEGGYFHNYGDEMLSDTSYISSDGTFVESYIHSSSTCSYELLNVPIPCGTYFTKTYKKFIECPVGQVFNSTLQRCELNKCEAIGLGLFKSVIDFDNDPNVYRTIVNTGDGGEAGFSTCYDTSGGSTFCKPPNECVLNCENGSIPLTSEFECASYFSAYGTGGDTGSSDNNSTDGGGTGGNDGGDTGGGTGGNDGGDTGGGTGGNDGGDTGGNDGGDTGGDTGGNDNNSTGGDSGGGTGDGLDGYGKEILEELQDIHGKIDGVFNADEYGDLSNSAFDEAIGEAEQAGDKMAEESGKFLDGLSGYVDDFKGSINNLVNSLENPLSTGSTYKTCSCPYIKTFTFFENRTVALNFDFCKFICSVNSATYLAFFIVFSMVFFIFLYKLVLRII